MRKVSSRHTEIPLNIFKYGALFLLDSYPYLLMDSDWMPNQRVKAYIFKNEKACHLNQILIG